MFKLKLIDLAKGSNISDQYKFYCSTLNWSRDQVVSYQNKRLKSLINHSCLNVPYYRNWMVNHNIIPQEINSTEELKKLPILDRVIIRQKNKDLIAQNYKTKDLHGGSSSGTTGIPINYYHDTQSISAGGAANYALWLMSGWKPGQKNIHIWGNASSIERWNSIVSKLKTRLMNQLNIPSTHLNENNISEIAEKIIRFKPKSIEGYPSAIYTLANHFKQNNLSIKGLKQVLTTAENLEDYQRDIIEATFAPTGDFYGSGEVMGIASRPIGDNRYYIFEPHVIVEAVDSGLEGMKDILVTDLDNYAMPMIRYKVGDLIDNIYIPETNSKYQFSYFKKLIGRSADIITLTNGMRFHPINIFGGTLFREFPFISKHRVVWDGKLLRIIFEVNGSVDDSLLKQKIDELLKRYDVSYSIEYTTKLLPSSNGKYKYVEIIK
ncbi:MAG: phenylacetate--CoA ligase family protein [Bacteroidales bacterium]|nr:phenylacetate--CoA ligase family protein [Bacteroidales bacterium]